MRVWIINYTCFLKNSSAEFSLLPRTYRVTKTNTHDNLYHYYNVYNIIPSNLVLCTFFFSFFFFFLPKTNHPACRR